ncbi:MAG: 1-(5-phosphoribosyl)-5-[(5-phosphoribosylamino)methylideneamino] imidazole-4-carboxamide isomerase [Deinococcales bacterium]|nr:1-(5-phosphoribosyl)-5-[(5-phosphoribosylamino)methylideneamino] imidazole-4-carboxamide isomerase [Deinococcales bacterium]
MRLLAAIDLRGGRTVQLVGGDPNAERVSLPDPLSTAQRFVSLGFRGLHVVDLDAALGHGTNLELIGDLVATAGVPVQVGGGVRDDAAAERYLAAGAARVIVGTRAVEEPAWLARLSERYPKRAVVACDVKDGKVVSRGWTASTALTARDFLATCDELPLAAVLVTDVGREGRLAGADAALFADLAAATRHPLQAAGGITTTEDLRALARAGVSAAVLGMSLYTGAIDPAAALREFQEPA